MRHGMILTATLLMASVLAAPAMAAPASLDQSFGQAGVVLTDFTNRDDPRLNLRDDYANDIAIQPDGKIVAVGSADPDRTYYQQVALARYNPDGSLDSSFGAGGKVTTKGGDQYRSFTGYEVDLQPDGKIVVAARSGRYVGDRYVDSITLLRYNSDGALDTSFGTGGKALVDDPNCCYTLGGLAIQEDGKIVVGGGSVDDRGFLLARFDQNGVPDSSFGSGGVLSTDFGSSSFAGANDVSIDPDGKIVAAGYTYEGTYKNYALARYNPNGSLDSSFGSGGRSTSNFLAGGNDSVSSLAFTPEGKILAGGTGGGPIVARFNTDGSLDNAFGSGGKTLVIDPANCGDADTTVNDLSLQANGKLVGTANHYGFTSFRLKADGLPDGSYGSGYCGDFGIARYPTDDAEYAQAVEIQPNGNIIVAGRSYSRFNDSGHYDFAVVRYEGGEDTAGPAITPVSPKPGATIRNLYPTIKATVQDDVSQLSKKDVKLYVKGTLVPAKDYSYYDDGNGGELRHYSDRLPRGKKISVKIVATDGAGNVGTKSWTFRTK